MRFFTPRTKRSWGIVGLSVWLILTGLVGLVDLHVSGLPLLMSILALASGVLILIGR
jgi:hypothetical protein